MPKNKPGNSQLTDKQIRDIIYSQGHNIATSYARNAEVFNPIHVPKTTIIVGTSIMIIGEVADYFDIG